MSQRTELSKEEEETAATLGRRVRLARLRRNLTQQDMAEHVGISRVHYGAIERGSPGASLGIIIKVMAALGYPDSVANLLASDPLGEDMALYHGKKRARR